MTAMMMDQVDARARAPEPREGTAGAAFHLLPGRVVAYGWLLAAVPIALLQLVHEGLHEQNEPPPVIHWLRDASLAVPFAAIAVVVAALLVARLRPAEPGERASLTTLALWGCLAAVLFAVLSIPGNQLHGFLFGAEEEEGVSLIDDLVADALYALGAALLVLAPIALLAGAPWRGAWRTAHAHAAPAQLPGPTPAATDGLSHSPATAGSTNAGGDR